MRKPTAAARRRWRCRVDGCRAWGYLKPGENGGRVQHAHYLEHHHDQPSEETH